MTDAAGVVRRITVRSRSGMARGLPRCRARWRRTDGRRTRDPILSHGHGPLVRRRRRSRRRRAGGRRPSLRGKPLEDGMRDLLGEPRHRRRLHRPLCHRSAALRNDGHPPGLLRMYNALARERSEANAGTRGSLWLRAVPSSRRVELQEAFGRRASLARRRMGHRSLYRIPPLRDRGLRERRRLARLAGLRQVVAGHRTPRIRRAEGVLQPHVRPPGSAASRPALRRLAPPRSRRPRPGLAAAGPRRGTRAPDLTLRPIPFCGRCEGNVEAIQVFKPRANRKARYGRQYFYSCPKCRAVVEPYYFAALHAIDLSIRAIPIGERAKHGLPPLKPRTMERIQYGIDKYGKTPLVVTVNQTNRLGGRVHPASGALFTQPASAVHGVAAPFVVDVAFKHDDSRKSRAADEPLSTQSARQTHAVVSPFVLHMQGQWRASGVGSRRADIHAGSELPAGCSPFALHDLGQRLRPAQRAGR